MKITRITRITLFKTVQTNQHYGRTPVFGDYETYLKNTVSFTYEGPASAALAEWFEFTVNDLCGTLLGEGDVDFLDAGQCATVKQWVEGHTSFVRDKGMGEFMDQFVPYLDWAIAHHTGITVEMS